MTSHQNDIEAETMEIDTLQIPQRDIDIPVPGVHITIVKEEDSMFTVYGSQSISNVPSLCYLCDSIVHVVFGALSSLRQVRTMRYICVHNHKHLNTFDSPSSTASRLFLENTTDEQCTTLKGTNLCGHFLVA